MSGSGQAEPRKAPACEVRTEHFVNCLGVFEGGGVRTSAFAGAYAAAVAAGIGFSDVAGTSGGSIAAALVATGATAEAIWDHLQALDLKQLASRGPDTRERLAEIPNGLKRIAAWMLSSEYRKIAPIVTHGGLYDSILIEEWVESVLRDLLKRTLGNKRITFADLPIPLYVVASDLGSREPKIWSRQHTPDESVALAVRCSCAIPFFFQPVRSGGTSYVDGGVVSKMPSFVFAQTHGQHAVGQTRRILTFRLRQAEVTAGRLRSPQGLAAAIVDTVVDGASKIQGQLQPNQFFIDIPTGDVSSTDFDIGEKQKKFLYDAGASAVQGFVRNEREELAKIRPLDRYTGRDERFLLYVQIFRNCNGELVILDETSEWLYSLFPALLEARKRGTTVTFVAPAAATPEEGQRRRLLMDLGVHVFPVGQLPYRGLVSDARSSGASVAVSTGSAHLSEETRLYTAGADPAVVPLLIQAVHSLLPEGNRERGRALACIEQPCAPENLFVWLRKVPQYQHAQFSLAEVAFNDFLHGVQTYVKEFKYIQINAMCTSEAVAFLQPAWIQLPSARSATLVLPPVVEKSGDRFIIIEGHVRAMHCRRRGMPGFPAVVVENTREPLPVEPRPFRNIGLESKTIPKSEQFPGHVDSRWRWIEREVRNAIALRTGSDS